MVRCEAAALSLVLLTQFARLAPTSPRCWVKAEPVTDVEGKPIEVAIGFYALDLARIMSRDESFDLTATLR